MELNSLELAFLIAIRRDESIKGEIVALMIAAGLYPRN